MNASDIEKKLTKLREDWKKYPEKRTILKIQAGLLQHALSKCDPTPKIPLDGV
jgi:hypothetical protein